MSRVFYVIVTAWLLALQGTHAQVPLVRYDSVAVIHLGFPLQNPWAGGMNSPQFSSIDLDGDGFKDLVVFERNFHGVVKTFLNEGIEGEASFIHAPQYQANFPRLSNWMLLRDYNCDGKEDIFTSVPAGIAVYRNDSGPGPGLKFTLITPLLQTFGLDGATPLYVSPPDIPAIDDIDGDGDLDILTFNIIGSTVEYHKNLSLENTGGCGSLDFELRNACWGYFSEDGNNNTVSLFDTCEVNVTDPEKSGRHAGSTILSIDIEGNGVKDLLLGDITYNNLVMLKNGGSTSAAIMTEQQTDFPTGAVPVDITVFPAAYHIDVNNDGMKDLLVAPNNPNTSENFDNVWYYKNLGTLSLQNFIFQQRNFLQEGMVDLGERSFPAFFDRDNDGLMDIVAGSYGYFENAGEYSSRLMLLRNSGTPSQPEFSIITSDFAELGKYGFEGVYPTFGDMDGDGDGDMIIGDEQGKLHYFENGAPTGHPASFILEQPNYQGIDIGQSAKPQIVDVNRDGLPDLLVGERSGTVKYFENTGSPVAPEFGSLPSVDQFGDIDVMPECCTGYSAPFMTEDSLGHYQLYVGSEQGLVYLFGNIENNLTGTFTLIDSLYLYGVNVNLSGADINGDGKLEFVYGELAGGIGLLKDGIPHNLGTEELSVSNELIKIFPNPVKDLLSIEIPERFNGLPYEISILNMMGQKVYYGYQISEESLFPFNVENFTDGIYLIVISIHDQVHTGKFIKR